MSSIENTTNIYHCQENITIKWNSLRFPLFYEFSKTVQSLIHNLGDDAKDDYWYPVIRELKKFRFIVCGMPFNNNELQGLAKDLRHFLQGNEYTTALMYPSRSPFVKRLIGQLQELEITKLAVLQDSLVDTVKNITGRTGVLIKESRYLEKIEGELQSAGCGQDKDVVVAAALRKDICFDQLIVIGPTLWYPDYVFSAPRSSIIRVLKFSWIRDEWLPKSIFLAPIKREAKLQIQPPETPVDQSPIPSLDILPAQTNFDLLEKKSRAELASTNSIYQVEARIFVLEGDYAVYIDADESSTVLVIDLDGIEDIRRLKVGELEPEMFVLLRTGGGGDYVLPIADSIMGDEAPMARLYQNDWKDGLRKQVNLHGLDFVIEQLKQFGSKKANTSNLNNWMSYRSIKTKDIDDFAAIMTLIGLKQHIDEYWRMMGEIDKAHLRAGQQIRRSLLEQVRKSDLNLLQRNGVMDFSIPGEASVSISAFKIRDFSPNTINVVPWRIGVPFKPEDLIYPEGPIYIDIDI